MDEEELLSKLVHWQQKPKKDIAVRIGDVVKHIVEREVSPKQSKFGNVAEVFGRLVPEELGSHCRVDKVSGGTLRVFCDSPAYANELRWCSEGLVGQMKKMCSKARIERIKVVVGRV